MQAVIVMVEIRGPRREDGREAYLEKGGKTKASLEKGTCKQGSDLHFTLF